MTKAITTGAVTVTDLSVPVQGNPFMVGALGQYLVRTGNTPKHLLQPIAYVQPVAPIHNRLEQSSQLGYLLKKITCS